MRLLLATGVALVVASVLGAGSAAAATSCFGAAARDPDRPCVNGTRSFVPKLKDKDNVGASPCRNTNQKPRPVCTFGTSARRARSTIALIGDSHALHWRAALDHVAKKRRWRAYSITTPACFFSEAVHSLVSVLRPPCLTWFAAVKRWLRDHPEVSTVFVSQNAPTVIDVGPGQTELGIKMDGYARAWAKLPTHVTHLVVIRDTPIEPRTVPECVRRALVAGKRHPGPACSTPRAEAVLQDAAFEAVNAIGSTRFRAIDMTDFFCGSTDCYPVIGGVLVHRDVDHMTVLFSQTLGPYLLREVRLLMRDW